MGNRQSRKRQADEEDGFPPLKRARLEVPSNGGCSHEPSTSFTHEAQDIPVVKKRPRQGIYGLLHRTSQLGSTNGNYSTGDNYVSCSLSPRGEYPVPWLEALFLPEFPVRSAINENSFIISNELGSGSFGRVFRATARHDRRGVYAIKVQEKSKVLGRNAVLQVRREASILRLLRPHVFVTKMYATWQSRTKLFSVLQYPVGGLGDLFSLWKDYGTLDEETLRIYAAELACAIDFIHRSGIIYRDLKLENVILDADAHIQIIDFGLAKQLRNGSYTNTICGTLQYMSPCVSSGLPYSHYVDWWSYAVTIHILFTGRYPYPNADAKHHGDLKFIDYSTPPKCSKELGNFLDRLLHTNKDRRLCCFEVIHAHPFFDGIDFEDVEAKMYNPMPRIRGLGIPLIDSEPPSETDTEDHIDAFNEEYEFNDFAYFNDNM